MEFEENKSLQDLSSGSEQFQGDLLGRDPHLQPSSQFPGSSPGFSATLAGGGWAAAGLKARGVAREVRSPLDG